VQRGVGVAPVGQRQRRPGFVSVCGQRANHFEVSAFASLRRRAHCEAAAAEQPPLDSSSDSRHIKKMTN
jgi:hypothetical protein